MNKNVQLYFSMLSFVFLLSIGACKKKQHDFPLLTLQKHIVDVNRASVKVFTKNMGTLDIEERGICWSINENPTVANNTVKVASKDGFFESIMNGLKPITKYFVRAYAVNQNGTVYSNQISFTTVDIPKVGDHACGGIVFYIYQPNDLNFVANESHGLVANISDVSNGIQWGCEGTIFTTTNNALIGMGKWNTDHILKVCTDDSTAAELCSKHNINGYDDWFLPSKDELNLLYLKKQMIGGFGDAFYWSSTEYSLLLTHMQYLTTGVTYFGAKRATLRVRPVREF